MQDTAIRLSALLCAALTSESSVAATLHVPADYPSIQQAIDASIEGDVVSVAAGTYAELIDFTGHDIAVESENGPAATIIDATLSGTAVTFRTNTRSAVLTGFTITGGKGDFDAGGVRVISGSATVAGNVITHNLGDGMGNGISLMYSDALIEGNDISDNASSGEGTGGGGGGGIGVLGAACDNLCGPEIRGNRIARNSIAGFVSGGGIDLNGGGPIAIVGNVIQGNTAPFWGGGISMVNRSEARIENNVIVDNHVPDEGGKGGGVYWMVPTDSRGPFLIGNTIADNGADHGSGVFAEGFDTASRIANNIIVAADGGTGLECGDVWDDVPPMVMDNDVYVPGGAAYAGVCASANGTDGNLSADPAFGGPGDYALRPASPALDAGLDAFVTESLDIAGQTRILDGNGDGVATVDMGAYERATDAIFANGFGG